jgi:signal peptidase I
MKIMHENIPSNPPPDTTPIASNSQRNELVKLVLLALIIVIPFRLFIAQPFIVDGASMDPTFKSGQYLIVDKLNLRFNSPERGTVLIFKYPKNPKKYYIKRLIALPGETISIRDGVVTIINNDHPEGLILDEPYVEFEKKDNLTFSLGPDEYFVLGDNRIASADSRVWGPVPTDNLIGRPILRVYPPTLMPGSYRLIDDELERDEVMENEESVGWISKLKIFNSQ